MADDSLIRITGKAPQGVEKAFHRYLKNPNSINAENFDLLNRARSGLPGFIPTGTRRYLGGAPRGPYQGPYQGVGQRRYIGGMGGGRAYRAPGAGGGGDACCQALLTVAKEQLDTLRAIAAAIHGGGGGAGGGGGGGGVGGAGGGGRKRMPWHIRSLRRLTAKGLSSLGIDAGVAGAPDLNPALIGLGIAAYGASKIYGAGKAMYGMSKPYADLLINASRVSRLTGTHMGGIAGRFMTGAAGRGYAPNWMLNMGYTMPEAIGLMGTIGTAHAGRAAQAVMQYAGRSKYLGGLGLNVVGAAVGTAISTGAIQNNTQSVLKYLGQFAGALKEAAKEGIQTSKAFQGIQSVVTAAQGLGMGAPGTATAAWAASLMGGGVKAFRTGAGQMAVMKSIAGVMGAQSGLTQTVETAGIRSLMGGKMPTTQAGLSTLLKKIGGTISNKTRAGALMRRAILEAARSGNYSQSSYLLGNALKGQTAASIHLLSAGLTPSLGGRLNLPNRITALSNLLQISPDYVTEILTGKKVSSAALKKGGMFGVGAGAGKALKLEATVKSSTFKIGEATFDLGAGALIKGFSKMAWAISKIQQVPSIIPEVGPHHLDPLSALAAKMYDFINGKSSSSQESGPASLQYNYSPYAFPYAPIPNHVANNVQGYLPPAWDTWTGSKKNS